MTIQEVYEKYKHLDAAFLLGPKVLGGDEDKSIIRNLWQAIKTEVEKP